MKGKLNAVSSSHSRLSGVYCSSKGMVKYLIRARLNDLSDYSKELLSILVILRLPMIFLRIGGKK